MLSLPNILITYSQIPTELGRDQASRHRMTRGLVYSPSNKLRRNRLLFSQMRVTAPMLPMFGLTCFEGDIHCWRSILDFLDALTPHLVFRRQKNEAGEGWTLITCPELVTMSNASKLGMSKIDANKCLFWVLEPSHLELSRTVSPRLHRKV